MTMPTFQPQAAAPATGFSLDNDADMDVPRLSQGTALVEVRKLELVQLEPRQGGLSFFAQVRVVSCDNPADASGSERKYKRGALSNNERAGKNAGELRQFFGALLGVDPAAAQPVPGETWDQLLKEAVDQGGTALAGRRLVISTADAVAQTTGNPFKKSTFAPAPAA